MNMKLILAGLLIFGLSFMALSYSEAVESPQSIVLTKDNTITLNDVFTGQSVAKLAIDAKAMDARVPSSEPIYLVLNSPGGSIDAGIELIEILENLKRPVKTISLFSASMGFQTVQGLGERLVTKDGTLMSHKASGGFEGEFPGQLDSRYGYYLKRVNRLDERVVARTGGKHTIKSYRNLIENEFWCDGSDCIKQGFADRVVAPSCDKSLEGTRLEVVDRFFMEGMAIEIAFKYDVCPINTNVLDYTILVDGKPLFGKTEAPATTNTTPSYLSIYMPASPTLSERALADIYARVHKLKQDRSQRKVIKGY